MKRERIPPENPEMPSKQKRIQEQNRAGPRNQMGRKPTKSSLLYENSSLCWGSLYILPPSPFLGWEEEGKEGGKRVGKRLCNDFVWGQARTPFSHLVSPQPPFHLSSLSQTREQSTRLTQPFRQHTRKVSLPLREVASQYLHSL